ncbi:integral membrane sensor signal transduction histidine kinase [Arcobacter nitrofigilis DSM 7299]|uniref:histidine kinase n=1 Tax=Arcobacter nitrofigilis (strain ATCC 33309 / DSM 7299 / CCUG 15893 / LMG 7604 / NCTC 12251 / CI) TaxID=572480 RepID=D5V049_ARCNC|nr:ATP-binding protein [Arcobacter nitrofigilis]ADG93661.1 integral membrane sensor signal transduction histidine kinase [Arcobacter nitrofigilis DSM 7299]
MKYDSKLKFLPVKTKTIILVLAIYILLSAIFFFIRYLDIKDFALLNQNAELKRVQQVYTETLNRTKKFYINRGYANINSYGIKEAFKNSNKEALDKLSQPRWNIIKKENSYLKSFCFYDKEGDLLTYFGASPESKLSFANSLKKPYDGFWFNNKSFDYHTVSEARDKNSNIIGYVVFVIDPKYFLSEIRKLINIYAFISYQKANEKEMRFMLNKDTETSEIIKNNKIKIDSEIRTSEGLFLPYAIKGKGINSLNDFKIIFLQDVLHWKKILQKAILQSLIIMVILVLITIMVINYGFDKILKELDESNEKLKISQNKLEELNKNLQIKIEKEIKLKLIKQREANEKERIIAHQSKLASMGEMIGNIAHQWRQPLTEVSSILINMELHYERDKLTKEKFHDKVNEINEQVIFMSKTIDDFRNFFSSGKQKESVNISSIISSASKLMSASLENNAIECILNIKDDFEVYCYPNEISQALLNIISNAKDIVIERGIIDAKIEILAYKKDTKSILSIEDNAGGIKVFPLDKIFEPYFSTKQAKSGTGIGLYMTKTIIEKNNSGKIEIKNSQKGAIFTIIF